MSIPANLANLDDDPLRRRLIPGNMLRVILESPFAGATPEIEALHVRYARAAVRDSLLRGEAPLASHLLYTQPGILLDTIPQERQQGINAGHAWICVAHGIVVYQDLGISNGMKTGIARAIGCGLPIEYRNIPERTYA